MEQIILKNLGKIAEICRKYHVKTMYVFGSATGRGIDGNPFGPDSDVDLLVEFEDIVYDVNSGISGFQRLDMQEELETIFGRKVDLVSIRALRNPVLIRNINKQKQLIYGRAS